MFVKKQELFVVATLMAGILLCMVGLDSAEEDLDIEDYHYDCKKIVWKIAKKVFSQFRKCSTELKEKYPNDKKRAEYLQCAVRCTMTKMEMVDNTTGTINEHSIDMFMGQVLKPAFHDIARVILGGCVEDFDALSAQDRLEDHCHAYGDLLKCLQHQLSEVC